MKQTEQTRPSLWELFSAFTRIGVLTFGGGVAMLPMLEKECIEKHSWATEDEMLDYFAIGQCTPGVIAVNTATFIGYKTRGTIGGIIATLGVVFPSFVIITAMASVLKAFQDNAYVAKAFSGIRVAVCALMLSAVIRLAKKAVTNIPTAVIAIISLVVQVFFGVSPIIVVISAIALGLIVFAFSSKEKTSQKEEEKEESASSNKEKEEDKE